jgi:hypothetical protein
VNPDNYGLVEMVLSFGLVLGFCFWQLRSLAKAKQRLRDKTAEKSRDPGA